MIVWLIVGGYLLVAVLCWRRFAWMAAHDMTQRPDTDDLVDGVIFGGLFAVIWPLSLLVLAAAKTPRLLSEPRSHRLEREAEEREEENRRLRDRISQLERETGIGGPGLLTRVREDHRSREA